MYSTFYATMLAASTPANIKSGHSIEYWLEVLTATGIFCFGWTCVLLRIVNRLCHDAADPSVSTRWANEEARGRQLSIATRLKRWLWLWTNAGDWSRDSISLGEWTGLGSLIGVTAGFVAHLVWS